MNQDASRLFQDALRLPPEVRAALASALLESLDDSVDEDAETAWCAEIARRLADLDGGNVRAIPWAQARRSILGERDGAG